MKFLFYFILTFIPLIVCSNATKISIDTIRFSDVNNTMLIGNSVQILEDASNALTIKEVILSTDFVFSKKIVPDLGVSNSSFWVEFKIKNNSNKDELLLELANPIIDEVELYTILPDGNYIVKKMGEYQPFYLRAFNHPSYVFNLKIPSGTTTQFFIKLKANEQLSIPLKLGTPVIILDTLREKDLLFGIYIGIMLAMFFYNIFIYFITNDRSYLYYIVYILFVGLTQSCFQGYTFQFLWSNSPWLAQHSVVLLSALVGISAAEFARIFLIANNYIKYFSKILYIFYTSYIVCIILSISGKNSMPLIDLTALFISIYLLIVAIIIVRKGYRPANFFLFAWIVFLIGVIVFALKNFGILPYNNITIYTMPAGSALEAILLSFALADRINILKKEKEQSQAWTLLAFQENEKLIKEQNVILEQKVGERTLELRDTNDELHITLYNLKNTQTQLVNAEKMASLGQLTAGIAHEINNPINFVSANVKPLKMDIDDLLSLINKYEALTPNETTANQFKEIEAFRKEIDIEYLKKEMEALLSGIEDGAKRTAEIVSGLKNFSRLDESDIKEANINEGIESTLILLKSTIPPNTEVITHLGEIPLIECLPGKLNQVFMNLFSNALYAIKSKKSEDTNKLIITTYLLDEHVYVSIEDTGIGMTNYVKDKIFDPFFTTKDVGEGTGLGMSIVFKIMESHGAKIQVESEFGVGTKILLILNKKITVS